MSIERKDMINAYIQEKGEIKLCELEDKFPEVSTMTLRRDLAYLEKLGYIVRTRGGAKSLAHLSKIKEEAYSSRAVENIDEKMIVAKKAVEFIETGRSIFIDSGSTTMCLTQILPNTNLSILTSAPNIALEIIKYPNATVNLIGGELNRDNISISGSHSVEFIKNINIDIAFVATSGFTIESGFTVGNFNECELKRTIIKKARKIILLMTGEKIDKNLPFTFATLKDIDVLICNEKLPDRFLKAAEKNKVKVL